MSIDDPKFWNDVDGILTRHNEIILSAEELSKIEESEQNAYAENVCVLQEVLERWKALLEERGFQTQVQVDEKGLLFTYKKAGYYGPARFSSHFHQKGALVLAQATRQGHPGQFTWANDLDENVRLGVGFDQARFERFLQDNLRDFLEPGNLILSAKEYDEVRLTGRYGDMLRKLQKRLEELEKQHDRQDAGRKLQDLLNEFFELENLSPERPFRVPGEEIDGSFTLDHEVYLIEAKWEKDPIGEGDLLVFKGKIEGKSQNTRGVFVTMSGISEPAKKAITTGKTPLFFVVDKVNLKFLLSGQMPLEEFLRLRQRSLAKKGHVVSEPGKLALKPKPTGSQ